MWIVVVKYSRTDETFLYESLEEAEIKYKKVMESGRIAYLARVIRTNL